MMEWHFMGMFFAVFLFMCAAILYEKRICSKIDKQLTQLEKLIDKQGERNGGRDD